MGKSLLLTLLSVALAVFGNVLNAVGFTVEKLGHRDNIRRNRGKSDSDKKQFFCNRIWIGGILLYGCGSAIIAAAMSFGPQSLLVPMESVTLVSNVFLSNRILKEPLRKRDLVGTAIIFLGVIMVITFGPRAESATGEYTASDLARMYLAGRVIVLFTGLISVALLAYLTLDAVRSVLSSRDIDILRVSIGGMPSVRQQLQIELAARELESDEDEEDCDDNHDPMEEKSVEHSGCDAVAPSSDREVTHSLDGVISATNRARKIDQRAWVQRLFPVLGSKLVSQLSDLREEKLGSVMLLSLCMMASVSSSWNFLSTKSVSEIFSSTSNGKARQNWSHPLTYILMASVILASVITEYWRQSALRLFGALHVVPIVQVTLLIGGIITGAVYFDELGHLKWWRMLLFCLAIGVDIVGIIVISWPGDRVDKLIDRVSSQMSLTSMTDLTNRL